MFHVNRFLEKWHAWLYTSVCGICLERQCCVRFWCANGCVVYAWPQCPSGQDTCGANTISAPNLLAVANAPSVRMGVWTSRPLAGRLGEMTTALSSFAWCRREVEQQWRCYVICVCIIPRQTTDVICGRNMERLDSIALCRDLSTRHLDGWIPLWTGGRWVNKWRSK